MKIGFVGLGVMGRPMAGHLVNAGHEVIVYNRSRPAIDELVAAGAVGAASLAEVGGAADTVITMLPDAADVAAVLFEEGGLLPALKPGSLVIDCSTIAPEAAASIGERLATAGVRFVDAPVSGGEIGALNGSLAVMMGGDASDAAAAAQVLDAVAGVSAHVGPVGAGQMVKAANQMLVAGNLALVSEALLLLERTGVSIPAALDVLNGGLAASRVLEVKAPKMLARDFTPGFRLDLHHKDLRIALAAAEQAGMAVPLTGIIAQLVQALRSSGEGGDDHGALIKAVERLSAPQGKPTFVEGKDQCVQH